MGKKFQNRRHVELSANHFQRRPPDRFIFVETSLVAMKPHRHAGPILPCIPFLRFRPRQRIKHLKLLFFARQPTRRFQRGTNFLRHRFDFIPRRRDQQRGLVLRPTPSNTTCAAGSCSLSSGNSDQLPHAFQLGECFRRLFLRRQFHRLAILGLSLPPDAGQLTGLKIGMFAPKSAAHRHEQRMRAGRCRPKAQCGHHAPDQTAASCRQCPPLRLHPKQPTGGRTIPASIAADFATSPPRILPCAEHPLPPPSARRTTVQSSTSVQAATSSRKRRGFARAGQTTQTGDAVTGAQDMVNCPLLILTEPVGRLDSRDAMAQRHRNPH